MILPGLLVIILQAPKLLCSHRVQGSDKNLPQFSEKEYASRKSVQRFVEDEHIPKDTNVHWNPDKNNLLSSFMDRKDVSNGEIRKNHSKHHMEPKYLEMREEIAELKRNFRNFQEQLYDFERWMKSIFISITSFVFGITICLTINAYMRKRQRGNQYQILENNA
ncbi:hypothetical protein RF11_13699 [Thelohanellus kitauei]|uniref:Uncharacterized protein n=1 Tax=Thelohanellus kitauei TaxID=669202 RepID=A0A0C2MGF4_THEKT|nr:hypothetical protein RF11_13699 [Thelohanellus kitauei]